MLVWSEVCWWLLIPATLIANIINSQRTMTPRFPTFSFSFSCFSRSFSSFFFFFSVTPSLPWWWCGGIGVPMAYIGPTALWVTVGWEWLWPFDESKKNQAKVMTRVRVKGLRNGTCIFNSEQWTDTLRKKCSLIFHSGFREEGGPPSLHIIELSLPRKKPNNILKLTIPHLSTKEVS